ncbi:DNA binding protein [Mycobacterium phage Collard]|uniref:Uncharacterized protein n=1 Tax=Mycobacterium phage Collard TaxID=2301704 RepID=A0A385DX18_9CAUD|nr:DNA binding protein [Mycobacterium phage Collard]AXQ63267.1 hypothetical protein SEA_COLLARD_93 [Mycobacterium phage Collard]UEM46486.1 hypothetical protein SEA_INVICTUSMANEO_92 [Mycobacterium phage InvictusManeo]
MQAASAQVMWLRQYLQHNGPTRATDVKTAGLGAGFSEQQINRAATQLEVHRQRSNSMPSYSTWSLPNAGQRLNGDARKEALTLANAGHHDLSVVLARTYTSRPRGHDAVLAAAGLRKFADLIMEQSSNLDLNIDE